MKTFAQALARHQPELDKIEMEKDMEFEMHHANTMMRLDELFSGLTLEQEYWFRQGWEKRHEITLGLDEISSRYSKLGRTIYVIIDQELSLDLPADIT